MNTHPPFKQIAGTGNYLYALDYLGNVWILSQKYENNTITEQWKRVTEEAA